MEGLSWPAEGFGSGPSSAHFLEAVGLWETFNECRAATLRASLRREFHGSEGDVEGRAGERWTDSALEWALLAERMGMQAHAVSPAGRSEGQNYVGH